MDQVVFNKVYSNSVGTIVSPCCNIKNTFNSFYNHKNGLALFNERCDLFY